MVSRAAIPRANDVLWHRRLCHRSNNYLEKNSHLLKGTNLTSADFVRGRQMEPCVCDACARTKAVMTPRVKGIKVRRSHAGEIATDLYGPFPDATVQGSFYLQAFVRVASGYVSVYGCARKNNSVDNLKDLLKAWPPPKTTSYHADGARELIGADIQKILDSYKPSIRLSFSTAYAPNENTFAERIWRTLADMAHPNLLLSELPFRFIEFAMKYAAWVLNRLPRQTDNGWMSPFEFEFDKEPDLSMARRWGCTAYYTVPHQQRRKGNIETGIKGYFMGLSDKQPYSWLIWDPKLNDIIASSNVNFIESVGDELLSSLRDKPSSKEVREIDFYHREFADHAKRPADYLFLIGKRYYDRDEREIFETTSVVQRGVVIVANRRRVVRGRMVGSEADNHCIHVADVLKMINDKEFESLTQSALLTQTTLDADGLHNIKSKASCASAEHACMASCASERACMASCDSSHACAASCASSHARTASRATSHACKASCASERACTASCASEHAFKASCAFGHAFRAGPSRSALRTHDEEGIPSIQLGTSSRGAANICDTYDRASEALPSSISAAILGFYSEQWYHAMFDEIDCIENEMKVWVVHHGDLPAHVKPLGTRFVFKVKEKENPEDDVFRARLVVQGFDQQHGIDFDETFSPTSRANTFRLFLYLILLFDMTLPVHLDAVKAYMNSDIDADIWVYPPKDPDEIFFKKGTVFKLLKALYGLKQAGRLWHRLAEQMLFDLGFKNLTSEPCFFYSVRGNILTFIILYVDDILISSQSPEVRDHLVEQMMGRFNFTNEGVVSEFLGIRITFVVDEFNRFILLDQTKMILDKVSEFGLEGARRVKVPMNPLLKLSARDELADAAFPYRQMIGSALHIARWTRCDASYTVSQLSRYNAHPTVNAAQAACQLWVYLRDTAHLKFSLSLSDVRKSNFRMVGLSDSDWAGDVDTRRSTTGWMVYIGLALINWVSQLQSFIAQSSMEAETVAANKLLDELLLMQNMFAEAGILPESHSDTPLLIDNQAAIQAAYNPIAQGKTKHFDIQEFHLRENTTIGRVVPTKIHTDDNASDILTKAVDESTLSKHRYNAGIRDFEHITKKVKSDEDWHSKGHSK